MDVGDIVALECPGNTSNWERDGRAVCESSTCTLDGLGPDEFGLYTCAEYEIVLIAGKYYVEMCAINIDSLHLIMCIFAGHTFGTQIKNGYSLLVYGLVALIVFTVSFGALTGRGQQIAQKCTPSHLRDIEMKSYCYIFAICFMVFLVVIGVILIFVSFVPRTITCG